MNVKMNDITVCFSNGFIAVDHVTLELGKGIYGLLGENGAGKTTLMRVLTTIIKPREGTVVLNGIEYREENFEKIKRQIGYLPQELNLYPDLLVSECLEYMGALSGVPKNECKERIEFYLKQTNLITQRKQKIKELSGGMKRRVGLIQALLHNPSFLIIDEPTTGLDPEERIRIRNLLVEVAKERTVLFSTHIAEDIAATCNQLAVMQKGKFLYTGTMQALLERTRGKIWSCYAQDDRIAALEQKYRIISKQMAENGMHIKFISDKKPQDDCKMEDATLEDAYMYLIQKDSFESLSYHEKGLT